MQPSRAVISSGKGGVGEGQASSSKMLFSGAAGFQPELEGGSRSEPPVPLLMDLAKLPQKPQGGG